MHIYATVKPTNRYANLHNPRKLTAFNIVFHLVSCFINLETYLNLEFLTKRHTSQHGQSSECSELSDIEICSLTRVPKDLVTLPNLIPDDSSTDKIQLQSESGLESSF